MTTCWLCKRGLVSAQSLITWPLQFCTQINDSIFSPLWGWTGLQLCWDKTQWFNVLFHLYTFHCPQSWFLCKTPILFFLSHNTHTCFFFTISFIFCCLFWFITLLASLISAGMSLSSSSGLFVNKETPYTQSWHEVKSDPMRWNVHVNACNTWQRWYYVATSLSTE